MAGNYILGMMPFFVALFTFDMFFLAVNFKIIEKICELTLPLFKYTGIYRASLSSGNGNYLYFWVYLLSFPVLFVLSLTIWLTANRKDASICEMGGKIKLSGALRGGAMFLIILVFCVFVEEPYSGTSLMKFFPPNFAGTLTYSLLFQFMFFFGVLPFLWLCHTFVKASNKLARLLRGKRP